MPLPLFLFLLLLLVFPSFALAAGIPNVTVLSCYDGDTCRVNLPRSLFADERAYHLFGENIPIRLLGIDTPEIRGACTQERALATVARDYLLLTIRKAATVTLVLDDPPAKARGKYFRILARVLADGQDVSELLIRRNLAVPYEGGKKIKDWCG